MGDTYMEVICVQLHDGVKSLILAGNKLSSLGITYLTDNLPPRLKELDLSNN